MIKFEDLNFYGTTIPFGIKSECTIGDYLVSIVINEASIGNSDGFYEMAIFKDNQFVNLPGIIEDDVRGGLTPDDITSILLKLSMVVGPK